MSRRLEPPPEERDDASVFLGKGPPLVRGARLEPIRHVERELTHPDGRKLRVRVPVYPPFRLEERPSPESKSKPKAKAPRAERGKRPRERRKAS